MKKATLLYFLCLWAIGSAYAQKISLSAGYSLLKMPVSTATREEVYSISSYINYPNSIDTYTVISKKARYRSSQNINYVFNNGFNARLNMQWNKGEKLNFNSGIGINFYDFKVIEGTITRDEDIISIDTIDRKYVFSSDNLGSNYKYKNFPSNVKEGINFKTLYLTLPFSIGYEIEKDKFGIALGGQIGALLRGKSGKEIAQPQYDYDAKEKVTWVSYSVIEEVKTANTNLNSFGFSYFAQLNYKYKQLGVNLEFAQNLTNLFRYDKALLGSYYSIYTSPSQYSVKPTSYTIKFVYYIKKGN